MPLSRIIEKLNKYTDRLERGKVSKIKASHVEKVIAKLEKREASLLDQIETEKNQDQKRRLKKKLRVNRQQVERARWLLKQLSSGVN